MTRSLAIAHAADYFDSGASWLTSPAGSRSPTESGVPGRRGELLGYLEREMVPAAARLGATARVADNPGDGGPLLIARRREDDALPTVLIYGHADVVPAEPGRWRPGLDPWRVTPEGDRWYGRGTADNKASTPSTWLKRYDEALADYNRVVKFAWKTADELLKAPR